MVFISDNNKLWTRKKFKERIMQKKGVFLLQESNESIQSLMELFKNDKDFEVVGSSTDGIAAISIIADKKPKFLITELILSGYDGLSVISKVKEMGGIKIVVLSAMCSDEIVKKAIELGADYYMAKPFDPKLLLERLSFIDNVAYEKKSAFPNDGSGNFYKISLDEKISKIFINVGIPPHIKGYVFLREGVKMAVNDPSVINNITKKLYPSIGEKFNTSSSKVERAIRHAIEVAWNRGRIDTINSILGVRAYIGAEKPTNGEFIALVADKMLLEKM